MKKILRRLAHRQSSERGFALPVALGFGLVCILVAGTFLIRTQDDKATASLQRASDSSLNVAEAGVTQVQAFLNAYRLFAKADLSDWTSTRLQNAYTVHSTCSSGITNPDTFASAAFNQQWQSIGSSGIGNGWYRVVQYDYNASSQEATLIVDGTISPESSSSPGTPALDDPQTSLSRLKVIIPVRDGTNGIPGLWVTNGTSGGGGRIEATNNNGIQANVLLNDCRVPLSSIDIRQPTGQTYNAQYTIRQFPPLPTKPAAPRGVPNSSDPNLLPSEISSETTLPQPAHRYITRTVNGQQVRVYQYLAQGNLRVRRDLTIDPRAASLRLSRSERAMVEFYLEGDLTTERGSADIIHSCSGISNCNSTDFQIFGYDTAGEICLNGNDYIDAFIFAPTYTAGVAGSARSGGFRGAVWVKEWSTGSGCGSNTNNIVVRQTGNWNYGNIAVSDIVPVSLEPIKCWEKLEDTQTTGTSCN